MKSCHKYLGYTVLLGICLFAVLGCSTRKNTAGSRFYHRMTTNYNVMYNGEEAFKEAYNSFIENYTESYSDKIFLDPIESKRGVFKKSTGGAFDKALRKGEKAIRLHSIRVKPKQKRNASAKERKFYKKKEYNTALYRAWLLVGKSQFYNGDFLEAMATFSYMSRIYADEALIRDEAILWQARCYIAMNWLHDGETLLEQVKNRPILEKKSSIYFKAKAESFLALNRYADAIIPLKRAIRKEANRRERMRMQYLLGQLYSLEKNQREATRTFKSLLRKAPPFNLEIATRLRLVEVEALSDLKKAIQSTERLARKGRNKDVLDRIYLTQGILHLKQKDTLQAIRSFTLGGEKSKEKKTDFALCQIALGNIYRQQRNWVKAQKAFASGVPALDKTNEQYEESERISKQLDALGIHARAVEEQDSLRTLAKMPEGERNKIIDSAITAYKKQLKEQKRNEALSEQEEVQREANEKMGGIPSRDDGTTSPAQGFNRSGKFYFYNPQLVTQGKAKFARIWGKRPLGDNWQRRKKEIKVKQRAMDSPSSGKTDSIPSGDVNGQGESSKEKGEKEKEVSPENDPTKREYYIAQLPITEEQVAASDVIIQQGLRGMGQVFEEEMELFPEAIHSLEDLLTRYPEYEERKDVFYSLFMINERIGKYKAANIWRAKLLEQFPEEDLSKAVADKQYIAKLKSADSLMNEAYQQIFSLYLTGRAVELRQAVEELQKNYPLSELLPKALYLKALSYVLENDRENFQKSLDELIAKHPSAEVIEPAQMMLAELVKGRSIARGGYTGLDYSQVFSKNEGKESLDSLSFTQAKQQEPQVIVLLYPVQNVDRNALLFAITTFNFSQFTEWNLQTEREEKESVEELLVLGFKGEKNAWEYIRKAFAPQGFMSLLPSESLLFAISESNLALLRKGKSIAAYFGYLSEEIVPKRSAAALALNRYISVIEKQKTRAEEEVAEEENTAKESIETEKENKETPIPKEEKLDSIPLKVDSIGEKDPILCIEKEASSIEKDSISNTKKPIVEEGKKEEESKEIVLPKQVTQNKALTYEDIQAQEKARKEQEKKEREEKRKAKEEAEKARKERLKERKRLREEARKQREQAIRERREKARQRREEQKRKRKERAEAMKQKRKRK